MANMISSFLNPEDAYKKAENESALGWNRAKGYEEPLYNQGQAAYPGLSDAMRKLLNPAELQNEWANNYETSPYAKNQLAANLNQGQEAASAMGLGGSSAAIGNIQQGAGNIQASDRKQFMDDLMQKYMTGIGLGQNLYGVGAQAGSNLANQSIEQGNNQAGLEFNRQRAPGQLFGQLAGTAANFIPGVQGLPSWVTKGAQNLVNGNNNNTLPWQRVGQ